MPLSDQRLTHLEIEHTKRPHVRGAAGVEHVERRLASFEPLVGGGVTVAVQNRVRATHAEIEQALALIQSVPLRDAQPRADPFPE